MGGNALEIETKRVGLDSYYRIRDEDSFGDLDLLLPKPKLPNLSEFLSDYLNSREIKTNNDIVSFEYKNFQVDLIHCPYPILDIAQVYFSYNDLGMLMGMLAKRVGCKYGHSGLYLVTYNESKSKKWETFLSKDPKEIFPFLGLDYERFCQGFDSLENVFDYVYSSNLFDSEAFLKEKEWNHRRRTRNRKRPTWQRFVDYI